MAFSVKDNIILCPMSTQIDVLNELAKKIGRMDKNLCCKLNELIDLGPGGGGSGTKYSVTVEQACDFIGGNYVPIEIIKYFNNGVYESLEYRDLEGNPYTIQGEIGLCGAEAVFDSSPIVNAVNNNTTQNTTENTSIIGGITTLSNLIADSQKNCGDGTLKTLKVEICNTLPSIPYNNNQQTIVNNTGSFTIAANTYHSISIAVIAGSATIAVGASTFTAPTSYTKQLQGTGLLNNAITVTGLSTGTLVVIDTIN